MDELLELENAIKADQVLWQERLDAVYEERDRLVALISSLYPSYIAIDEDSEDGFKNVVYIETPEGQLSWHIADKEVPLFSHLVVKDNNWDGHTTEEKYERIENLINRTYKMKEQEEKINKRYKDLLIRKRG